MPNSQVFTDAEALRSLAKDIEELTEKRANERREKSAATVVAAVSLIELKKILTNK